MLSLLIEQVSSLCEDVGMSASSVTPQQAGVIPEMLNVRDMSASHEHPFFMYAQPRSSVCQMLRCNNLISPPSASGIFAGDLAWWLFVFLLSLLLSWSMPFYKNGTCFNVVCFETFSYWIIKIFHLQKQNARLDLNDRYIKFFIKCIKTCSICWNYYPLYSQNMHIY